MKAVIFDMDGVIVDSQLHWMNVQSDFLASLVQGWTPEDQQKIIGMSMTDVHRLLVEQYGATVSLAEMVEYYEGLAERIYLEESSIFEGCKKLIQSLSEKGVKLAVASASPKPWIIMTVERFGLDEYFSSLVSSDDVGAKGKPAPDIYQYAAKSIGSEPEKCIAIEDSKKGVASAQGAGMYCFGFLNGYNKAEDVEQANSVIEGFGEQERTLVLTKALEPGEEL